MSTRLPRGRRRDERGAVAIMVALSLTALAVVAGMVLDFGLVRVDRQVTKSAADSAALAGAGALGLSGSDAAHPYTGICAAIDYLTVNAPRFGAMSPSAGTWTDGNGAATANGCDPASGLRQKVCRPGDQTTWARYIWDGTWQGTELKVTIQSGYQFTGTGWSEDSLPAAQAFADDQAQGCDQLAVVVLEKRKPGLGSLATSSELTSAIRSVARVKSQPGDSVPAMLLLKRTGCPVLQTGSNSGVSHIYVYGAMASNGDTQPGSVHADTTGSGCTGGSNQNVFLGKAGSGIVAFAAPKDVNYPACLASDTCTPDPDKPGTISSVASAYGAPSNVVSDGLANVFGSGAAGPSGVGSASKSAPTARDMVTRALIDDRYLGAVQGIATAASGIWGLTASNAVSAGYSVVNSCSPASIPNDPKIFVNCTANGGFTGPASFGSNTQTVVFNGSVKPAGVVKVPSATKVYIFGDPTKDAISLGTGSTLSVHAANNTDAATGLCSDQQSSSKAVMVVKSGDIKETGGLLQLCYTTVVMEGSSTNACISTVPAQEANGPTTKPCASGTSAGDGQLSQTGGGVDWTAPNTLDLITKDSDGNGDATAVAAWSSTDGPEDLAYWSESYGGSSSPTYSMAGGGTLHVVGVYMLPNADPFTIGGGASQTLVNAQYIASSIALNGTNTQIKMRVDPNSAVTTPDLGVVGLVR